MYGARVLQWSHVHLLSMVRRFWCSFHQAATGNDCKELRALLLVHTKVAEDCKAGAPKALQQHFLAATCSENRALPQYHSLAAPVLPLLYQADVTPPRHRPYAITPPLGGGYGQYGPNWSQLDICP